MAQDTIEYLLVYKCRTCATEFELPSGKNRMGIEDRFQNQRFPIDEWLFRPHDCFPFKKGHIGLADLIGSRKAI